MAFIPFKGAKIALLFQGLLIAYQRDQKPEIPFPGMWDLPGGGREDDESPVECAIRETREEFDIAVDPAWIVWTLIRHRIRPPLEVTSLLASSKRVSGL